MAFRKKRTKNVSTFTFIMSRRSTLTDILFRRFLSRLLSAFCIFFTKFSNYLDFMMAMQFYDFYLRCRIRNENWREQNNNIKIYTLGFYAIYFRYLISS